MKEPFSSDRRATVMFCSFTKTTTKGDKLARTLGSSSHHWNKSRECYKYSPESQILTSKSLRSLIVDQVFIKRWLGSELDRFTMESHTATYSTTAPNASNFSSHDDADIIRNSGKESRSATSLPSWFVVQLTITASLGGCLFGYDMGAISGTLPQLTNTFDLDDRQKELSKLFWSKTANRLATSVLSWYFPTLTFKLP